MSKDDKLKQTETSEVSQVDVLFERISGLIEQARQRVVTATNIAEVYTKYYIGQYIVQNEQQGKSRAEYGKQVLKELSARLSVRYGEGWSYSNLHQIRQFYMVYGNLTNTVCQIDDKKTIHHLSNPLQDSAIHVDHIQQPQFTLSRSRYPKLEC